MRQPEGSPHGVIDECAPRRPGFAHDVVRGADDQRRDPESFDHVCDETDGLMAERSIRDEQDEVNLRRD